jgi:hypothetical protein
MKKVLTIAVLFAGISLADTNSVVLVDRSTPSLHNYSFTLTADQVADVRGFLLSKVASLPASASNMVPVGVSIAILPNGTGIGTTRWASTSNAVMQAKRPVK